MKRKTQSNFSTIGGLIGLLCMLVVGNNTLAQQTIESTSDLKRACETSPGNVVTLNQSTKIYQGVRPTTGEEAVNCGCTLVLGPDVKLEFDFVGLRFDGLFTVRSANKGEVNFNRSLLRAPSITINLPVSGSALAVTQSLLQALAGSLNVILGDEAKMELIDKPRVFPDNYFPTTAPYPTLYAAGIINISGGRKFTGLVTDMGITAPGGVQLTMNGEDGLLKVEKVSFHSQQGSVAITATGQKNLLEMKESRLRIGNSIAFRFEGTESSISLKQIDVQGIKETYEAGAHPTFPATGGLIIEAGTGNASKGKIEISEFRSDRASNGQAILASANILASPNGQDGSVKLEFTLINSRGDLVVETGPSGKTEVKETGLYSDTRVRVASGAGGTCFIQKSTIYAPVRELCPSNVTTLAQNRSNKATMEVGQQQKRKIIIYPNPGNNGIVNVSFGNSFGTIDVFVVDIHGKTIRQWRSFKNNSLLISDLTPGFYNLKVVSHKGGEQKIEKFIIINR